MADNFIEQIRKRQEAIKEPAPTEAKSTEQMSGDELEEALNKAKRDLLDAQHAELREREIARVQGPSSPDSGDGRRALSDMLRERQTAKRRTWR